MGPFSKPDPPKQKAFYIGHLYIVYIFNLMEASQSVSLQLEKNHHHLRRTQFHFPYHIPQKGFFHYFELYSSYPSQSAPSSLKAIISRGIILASISLKPTVDCPKSFPCEGETTLFSSKEPTGDPCMYATQALRTCEPRRLKCSRTNSSKCCCKR